MAVVGVGVGNGVGCRAVVIPGVGAIAVCIAAANAVGSMVAVGLLASVGDVE